MCDVRRGRASFAGACLPPPLWINPAVQPDPFTIPQSGITTESRALAGAQRPSLRPRDLREHLGVGSSMLVVRRSSVVASMVSVLRALRVSVVNN